MGATKLQLVMMMVVAIISAGMMSTAMAYCPQMDELFAFKESLGGIPSDWIEPTSKDCCDHWSGLTCNDHHMVTGIQVMTRNSTLGKIPDNLAKFTALETLEIGYFLPNIDDPRNWKDIAVNNLANLTLVKIFGTKISSHDVLPVLGQIPNLKELILNNNNLLVGVESLVTAAKLEKLDLSNNRLRGSLPIIFPPVLKYLNLNGNKFEGEIPANITENWPSSLEDVNIAQNNLTGSPQPIFTAGKSSLRYLYLDGNRLWFNMWTAVLPTGLIGLGLSNNQIYGTISPQVNEIKNLSIFHVANNLLCGPIPSGVPSDMPPWYFENNLCLCDPPLPACPSRNPVYKTTSRDDAPLARPASLRVDPLRYRFLPFRE